jgi:hypothetical protein
VTALRKADSETARIAKAVLASAACVTVLADRESDIFAGWVTLPGDNFHLLTRSQIASAAGSLLKLIALAIKATAITIQLLRARDGASELAANSAFDTPLPRSMPRRGQRQIRGQAKRTKEPFPTDVHGLGRMDHRPSRRPGTVTAPRDHRCPSSSNVASITSTQGHIGSSAASSHSRPWLRITRSHCTPSNRTRWLPIAKPTESLKKLTRS